MEIDNRLADLNQKYDDADTALKTLASEQRTNILLYLGNHFNKNKAALSRFARTQTSVSSEKKIRLVKNHLGLICDRLINHTVTGHSPDVTFQAANKMEVQDKKASDIAAQVYKAVKKANNYEQKVVDFANDFVIVGEMFGYVGFDPMKGRFLGEEPILDELGQQIGSRPAFAGEVVAERWESFNVLTDPDAKCWEDVRWVIHRKMVDKKEVVKQFANEDREKIAKIQESSEETFTVFNAKSGDLSRTDGRKVLVKQAFFRPCAEYPRGYYVFYTSDCILAEGELHGFFPIVYRPYMKISTESRGYGVIRRLRPNQIEINRISSTIAESQVSFRTKLLLRAGSKITHGATIAGTQAIKYNGEKPDIMTPISGEQYLTVLQSTVSELYQLANLEEEEAEKVPNVDPNALLFRSLKEKKKFSKQSSIFESFLIEMAELIIKTAKLFYTDNHLIQAVDKKDYINIQEFKNISELDYSLEVKAQSADIESTLGQQMSIMHAIQYSQQLDPETSSILLANMPFLKDTHMAQSITADYRAAEDLIAQIERGEQPLPPTKYENHKYMMKAISNRMKESSFRFLNPQVQQLFQMRLQAHEEVEAQIAMEMQRAQQGIIPAGGALIPVSIYLDQENESKRVRVPHDSVVWLVQKLNEQGAYMESVQSEIGNEGVSADIAALSAPQMQQQTIPTTQPMGTPPTGLMNG